MTTYCLCIYSDIKRCVSDLSTGGSTALGPALALCVGMTSNFPSAEIIVCTDGVSNVGCGNISSGSQGTSFYSTVSVILNILSGRNYGNKRVLTRGGVL